MLQKERLLLINKIRPKRSSKVIAYFKNEKQQVTESEKDLFERKLKEIYTDLAQKAPGTSAESDTFEFKASRGCLYD